jgi:tRNA nucleotidyltransferase (CCA-adding enzyme)
MLSTRAGRQTTQKLLAKVLKRIKPTKAELERELRVAEQLIKKIQQLEGKHVDVQLCGSLARNTHIKNDRDFDIFVLFPEHVSRKEFEKEGLRIGKAVFEGKKHWIEYAEHPYVRGEVSGYTVEIVPSYKLKHTTKLLSSVDRSPLHQKYLEGKLTEKMKDDVRLLKAFMKGVGCYGAKAAEKGFSGYLCELLILHYGSFLSCLQAAAKWKKGEIIDIEHYWPDEIAGELFEEPLVVVDPTDKHRNVAAAVSIEQMARFVAAARAFLAKPSEKFFFKPVTKKMGNKRLMRELSERSFVILKLPWPKQTVPEIFASQLDRFSRKFSNALSLKDFSIRRVTYFLEDYKKAFLVLELEHANLHATKLYTGPEVFDEKHSTSFLKKHILPASGPRIENGRWVVEERRAVRECGKAAKACLKDALNLEKMPLREALKKAALYTTANELGRLYKSDGFFAREFSRFLRGREEFLFY